MRSFKQLLNSLSQDPSLRQLTDDESVLLRRILLESYQDLDACCQKHGLTMMLIGGTALGAVRHHGFIPWDDDLDVAMPRKDFEQLKQIFDQELGEKYVLSSPNYKGNARNRFPMMMRKNTSLVEIGGNPDDGNSMIKIDIFIIDNVPASPIVKYMKGLRCTVLMLAASYADCYENDDEFIRAYMCKTPDGARVYKRRVMLGRFLSFRRLQDWYNTVDRAFQYNQETGLMGIPSGRGHYFGEILPREAFLPASEGVFEGLTVKLPANPDAYLTNLYGPDYMTPPPVEKRERHFILDIGFSE